MPSSSRRRTLPLALAGSSATITTGRGYATRATGRGRSRATTPGSGLTSPVGNDCGDDDLAPARILDSDHRASAHIGMLHQDVLDLGGCDVLPAADDGVISSPTDEQVPVGVEAGHVAGGKPAIGIQYRADLAITARYLRSRAPTARRCGRAAIPRRAHRGSAVRFPTPRAQPSPVGARPRHRWQRRPRGDPPGSKPQRWNWFRSDRRR